MKVCGKCQVEKPFVDFYKKSGGGYRSWCRQCTRESVKAYNQKYRSNGLSYSKEYYEKNRERIIKRQKEYRTQRDPEQAESHKIYMKKYNANPINRAKWLHKRAMTRTLGKNLEFSLTLARVEVALLIGKCERTGIAFDFQSHNSYHFNPFSPSIDRIDSKIGYTDTNVQIVCTAYNIAKSEMTDIEFLEFCKIVVAKSNYRE